MAWSVAARAFSSWLLSVRMKEDGNDDSRLQTCLGNDFGESGTCAFRRAGADSGFVLRRERGPYDGADRAAGPAACDERLLGRVLGAAARLADESVLVALGEGLLPARAE